MDTRISAILWCSQLLLLAKTSKFFFFWTQLFSESLNVKWSSVNVSVLNIALWTVTIQAVKVSWVLIFIIIFKFYFFEEEKRDTRRFSIEKRQSLLLGILIECEFTTKFKRVHFKDVNRILISILEASLVRAELQVFQHFSTWRHHGYYLCAFKPLKLVFREFYHRVLLFYFLFSPDKEK